MLILGRAKQTVRKPSSCCNCNGVSKCPAMSPIAVTHGAVAFYSSTICRLCGIDLDSHIVKSQIRGIRMLGTDDKV